MGFLWAVKWSIPVKGLTCETPPPTPPLSTPPSLLLLPVVEHSQLRQAAELGEKYEDFRVLVQLCERTGNREQLREYMARFSAQVPSMATILGASFPGTTSGEWPGTEATILGALVSASIRILIAL